MRFGSSGCGSRRMVDVALFVRSLEGGGAERIAALLATEFHRRGMVVQVIVQFKVGPWEGLLSPGIEVIELGGRLRYSLGRLRRYLRTERPSAVLSFTTELNLALGLAAYRADWGGRMVFAERVAIEFHKQDKPHLWPLYRWGMSKVGRRAHATIAVSKVLADSLVSDVGIEAGKVFSIPNPLDAEALRSLTEVDPVHPFFDDGSRVVCAAGRLEHQKGFDTLIDAFSMASREDPKLRLLVLGEGPMRTPLEAQIRKLGLSECVDLPGFVDPIAPWLRSSDVFVLSSRFEGWPNVLAEALALHLPVVATDCPTGPSEILGGGAFGRLVDVDDALQMCQALLTATETRVDPWAVDAWIEQWSPDAIASRYLDVVVGHV